MKGSSSKKVMTPTNKEIADQYKSEGSRVSASNLSKDKFSVQNMKEFKCEIDHQIAKCLDTLDRQGLKFLKETLRASKLFGLNTQELTNNPPVEESVQSEESSSEKKVDMKKPEPVKNIQVKKVNKPELQKKPTTAQKNKPFQTKNDLGDKIQKKLQSLNIKTGKKTETKPQNVKPKQIVTKKIDQKPSSSHEIVEEIETQENIEQQQKNIEESLPVLIEEEIKNSFVENSPQQKQVEASWSKYQMPPKQNFQSLVETPQEEVEKNLLKPFCRKQFKKSHHGLQEKHQRYEIDFGMDEITPNEIQKPVKIEKIQLNKGEKPISESFREKEENTPIRELSHKTEQSMLAYEGVPAQLMALIQKIKKLPTNKIQRLERVLERIQDPNLSTSMLSIGSQASKNQVSYMKPFVPIPYLKDSEVNERSKSRSKLQKLQKASSIKGSMVKRYKESRVIGQFQAEENERKVDISEASQLQKSKELVLDSKQEEIKGVSGLIKKEENLQVPDLQCYQTFRAKEETPNNSQLSNKSGQKLIKISIKKSTISTITIKILSNKGHSSLVGLSSILIYGLEGDLISITQNNFKQPNSKLLKLFSQSSSDGWISNLSNASISIESINKGVGGIRILNFNKSELENNKQADLIQILIDGQLHWRGQLRGGSFKEDQSYITDVKVANRDFQFPMQQNPSLRGSYMKEKSQGLSWLNLKQKDPLEPEKKQKEIVWLEKQSISKIKELEELDKNESKVKRIQSIRNTQVFAPKEQIIRSQAIKVNEEKPYNLEISVSPSPQKHNKSKFRQSSDILGQLSKSIHQRKKIQVSEPSQSSQKHEEIRLSKEKQMQRQREKEKQQDDEFNQIIRNLEKQEKRAVVQQAKIISPNNQIKKEIVSENKSKKIADRCFEEFMKDSLFEDLNQLGRPAVKSALKRPVPQENYQHSAREQVIRHNQSKKSMKNNLDDLIDELNDVVGTETQEETGEQFTIPELPSGKELTMVMISNWGNQQFIGLNGLELFDSNGDTIKPIDAISSSVHSQELISKLFKSELMTSDENSQLKLTKNKKIVLLFVFPFKVELAAIRIWNFNGHRVHNNIGVKKCHLRLDNQFIFSGQIKQGSGSSEDAHKHCEYILFTENGGILKKIAEKDWLNKKRRNNQEEKMLFKSTLQNFHRPPTRNDEQMVKKDMIEIQVQKQPIKLPKRMVFEYEPPQLPEGFTLKFILHSSWGDRFFIGLNGIEIFNENGEIITNQKLSQIVADPSSIAKLQGYEGDKRVVTNLINGQNSTTCNTNIWLAPLLSDVQKIQKGRSNLIIMDYSRSSKISGINFYNYTKTPERGVREIEIYLDNNLLYRGYLRKYNREEGIVHTTINFTKEQKLLEAMNYCSYNEDHLEQEVGLVNEEKVVKSVNVQIQQVQLNRPMTGKLLV